MPTVFRDAQGNLHTANTPEQVAAFQGNGWTPVNTVLDQDFRGDDVIRAVGVDQELNSMQQQVTATPEAVQAAQGRVERDQIVREANTSSEQFRAGASGLASGLTFGLSAHAGFSNTEGLSEGTRDIVRQETENAEMAGLALSAVSPWGAEAMLTRGAARLVAGSGFMRSLARMTLEGAGGGAINASHETAMSEGTIQDFAERVGSDMVTGALFGGALGVPIAGTGVLARRLMGRGNTLTRASSDAAIDAAEATHRTGELGDALRPQQAQTRLGRATQTQTGDPNLNYSDPQVRRAVRASEDVASWGNGQWDNAARDASHAMSRVDEASGTLRRMDDLNLSDVSADIGRSMRGGLDELQVGLRQLDLPNNAAGRLARSIDDSLTDVALDAAPSDVLNRMLELEDTIGQQVEAAGGLGNPNLNSVRGHIQDVQTHLQEAIQGNAWGASSASIRARHGTMQQLRDAQANVFSRLRANGQFADEGVRGAISNNPSAIRDALRKAIESGDVSFPRALHEMEQAIDAAAGSGVPNLASGAGATRISADLLDSLSARAQDLANSGGLARKEASSHAARHAVQSAGIMGMAFGGGAVGGLTAVAGMGVAAVRNKAHLRRSMFNVADAFRRQDQVLATSFQKVRSVSRARSASPFIGRMRVTGGTLAATLINGSSSDREEAYTELTERVAHMANNPQMMAQSLEGQVPGAADIDPNLPSHIGMAAMLQMQALASALPRGARTGYMSPQLSTRPTRPSRTAINEFLTAAAVIEDPSFSLELLAAGRLSEGAARAVSAAHPRFHQAVSGQLMQDLANMHHRGERMNYQASIVMSRFVGIPMDPTLEPGFNSIVTSQSAQTPAQEAQQFARPVSTRQPDMISQSMTPSERIQ